MFLTKTDDAKTKDASFTELYQFVDPVQLSLIQTNDDLLLLGKEKLLDNTNKSKFAKHVMQLGTSSGMKIIVNPKDAGKKATVVEDGESKTLYDAVINKLKSENAAMEAFLEDTKKMTKEEAEKLHLHFQLYEDVTGIQELYNAFDTNHELELLHKKLDILFGAVADCNKALLHSVDYSKLKFGECAKNMIQTINANLTNLTAGTEADGKTTYTNPFEDNAKKDFVEFDLLIYRTLKAREVNGVPVTPEMTTFYGLFDKLMARFVEECKPADTTESAPILAKVLEISGKYDVLLAGKYLLKDSLKTLGDELQAQIAESVKLAEYHGELIKAIYETHGKKYDALKKLQDLLALDTLVTDFEGEITTEHAKVDGVKTDKTKLEELQKIFEHMLAFFNENKDLFGDDTKQGQIESGLNANIDAIKAHIACIDGKASIDDLIAEAQTKTGEITTALADTAKTQEELETLQTTSQVVLSKFTPYTEADFTKYPELKPARDNLNGELQKLTTKIQELAAKKAIADLIVEADGKSDEIKAALLVIDTKSKQEIDALQTSAKAVFDKFTPYTEADFTANPNLKTAMDNLKAEWQKLATIKKVVDELVVEAKNKTDEIKTALGDATKTSETLEALQTSAKLVFGKFTPYTEADFTKYPELKPARDNLNGELQNLDKKIKELLATKKAIAALVTEAKAKTDEIKSAVGDKTKTVDDLEKVQKESKDTLQKFEQFKDEIKTEKDLSAAKDALTKELDILEKRIAEMKKTPEPPKKKEEEPKESEGLSTGAIIGIVIGVIAAIAVVGVVGWLIYKQNMSPKKEIEEEEL